MATSWSSAPERYSQGVAASPCSAQAVHAQPAGEATHVQVHGSSDQPVTYSIVGHRWQYSSLDPGDDKLAFQFLWQLRADEHFWKDIERVRGRHKRRHQTDPLPFTPEQPAWIDQLIVNCQEQWSGKGTSQSQTAALGDPQPPTSSGETCTNM